MSFEEIETHLCDLVERSLQDSMPKEEFVFQISSKIVESTWKYYFYYLEKFKSIEKTTARDTQTGKMIPCLTFTKQLKNKRVKIVKLNLSRKKLLSLKTLYEIR